MTDAERIEINNIAAAIAEYERELTKEMYTEAMKIEKYVPLKPLTWNERINYMNHAKDKAYIIVKFLNRVEQMFPDFDKYNYQTRTCFMLDALNSPYTEGETK